MSLGLRAEANNTSAVISVAGVDQVVINNAGDVTATTFTGALVGTAATATALSTTTGVAPVYGVRAWVNFDGTKDTSGATSTADTPRLIRTNGSGNVSSVSRSGAGKYTVNFSIPMPNENYAVTWSARNTGSGVGAYVISNGEMPAPTASSFTLITLASANNVASDLAFVNAIVVG